jgi:hypothetical protein
LRASFLVRLFMHTLDQLRRGELSGITRLDLSAGFNEFPREIFDLADSLEVLNLSGNQLRSLPADLPRLHKLRILFCSENPFRELPEVLGQCSQLEMIGFKSCQIERVSAAALPERLRWLVLTDNQIPSLPAALGDCSRLQKLMLAGNQLETLPSSLADCQNLELLRIAANRLQSLPNWLMTLPKLAWLAYAGNPFVALQETAPQHHMIPRSSLVLGEMLGQGASGIIHRAQWQRDNQPSRPMAVKLFKGHITSDGLPQSEMAACLRAGEHPNLISVAGLLETQANAPAGLLMELIDPAFTPLAGPPSLSSCTRDSYAEGTRFTLDAVLRIARGTASAISQLHARGILHGDLYAHNLLVNPEAHSLLGDFGAASFFDPHSSSGQALQRIEARAFGNLLEELLQHCAAHDQPELQESLKNMSKHCTQTIVMQRPTFTQILEGLTSSLGQT